jgi:hypothetical protein
MEMARKLEDVRRDLALLAEQGKIEGFLNNVGNADKLGGLLEDIRDAMMEYQVCMPSNYFLLQCLMSESDFVATRYLRQELSAHRESHPSSLIHVE